MKKKNYYIICLLLCLLFIGSNKTYSQEMTYWYLTKIEFPNSDGIEFIYEKVSPMIDVNLNINALSNTLRLAPEHFLHYSFQALLPVLLKEIKYRGNSIINIDYKNTTQLEYPRKYLSAWSGVGLSEYRHMEEFDISDSRWADFGRIVPITSFSEFKRKAISQLNINLSGDQISYKFHYIENANERLKLEKSMYLFQSNSTFYNIDGFHVGYSEVI
ncbi:MAG: hypothetical protein LBU51_02465 [Bacteroidales bacterium]|jgi:hypothetical protein|nr:hypothetical protein [Bacteroidales bacterium]